MDSLLFTLYVFIGCLSFILILGLVYKVKIKREAKKLTASYKISPTIFSNLTQPLTLKHIDDLCESFKKSRNVLNGRAKQSNKKS